jgi:hypothetical protein
MLENKLFGILSTSSRQPHEFCLLAVFGRYFPSIISYKTTTNKQHQQNKKIEDRHHSNSILLSLFIVAVVHSRTT